MKKYRVSDSAVESVIRLVHLGVVDDVHAYPRYCNRWLFFFQAEDGIRDRFT